MYSTIELSCKFIEWTLESIIRFTLEHVYLQPEFVLCVCVGKCGKTSKIIVNNLQKTNVSYAFIQRSNDMSLNWMLFHSTH
jgi:hypothetical protein